MNEKTVYDLLNIAKRSVNIELDRCLLEIGHWCGTVAPPKQSWTAAAALREEETARRKQRFNS